LLDAYQNQQGWPGRMPWGGVYPPMKNVWELVNKKERIWSMHIHSYCMLPDCNLQTYMSFRLSPHTDIIYYGTPLAAKKILQEEGLNYFFISLDLQLRDPLPLSPLFNPDNISNYLGIYWTDGNNALLTWKENAKETIPTEWLTGYRKIILDSPTVQSFPYQPLSHLLQTAVQPSYTVTLNEIPWNHAGWH